MVVVPLLLLTRHHYPLTTLLYLAIFLHGIVLMVGGAFLCFEGFEKIAHKYLHSPADIDGDHARTVEALADPAVDLVAFEKDKMKLRVPVAKATAVGMRKLSETDFVERALKVVQGKARVKRTMWSRRAQEYDAKINSGDLISIAEVVRDLYRAENQPEQSYSERQLYEAALDRMAREIAAVNKMSETEAVRLVEVNLAKGPKRGKTIEEDDTQEEAA